MPSETLDGALPLIETTQSEIIKAGGPSSSLLLSNLRDAAVDDIIELDRRTAQTAADITQANTILGTQLTSLTARFAALNGRLPATAGRWLADFYSSDFVDGSGDALVNPVYGQVTLPILSAQEKLVGQDSRGQIWIPKETQVSYSYKSTTPSEVDWLADNTAVGALDQRRDTAWWRSRATAGAVWVRVRVPSALSAAKAANTLVLHPMPALEFHLVSAEYRKPDGTWTTLDLSYLSEWDGSRASWIGNVRLFFPAAQVTELRLQLSVNDLWGFGRISLQQLEFQAAATLIADFTSYSPGTLGAAVLFGKDPDALAGLTTSINGQKVAISLAQNAAGTSPIITGVEVRP